MIVPEVLVLKTWKSETAGKVRVGKYAFESSRPDVANTNFLTEAESDILNLKGRVVMHIFNPLGCRLEHLLYYDCYVATR